MWLIILLLIVILIWALPSGWLVLLGLGVLLFVGYIAVQVADVYSTKG